MEPKVCLGMIVAAHGIRGEVKVRSFTENPHALTGYGPLTDPSGRVLKLKLHGAAKPTAGGAMLRASVEGVTDRNGAEALRNTRLMVPRSALPAAAEGEYYHADLVGLQAETPVGEALGRVVAVQNFGAGDLLDILPAGAVSTRDSVLVPFTDAAVPTVDLAAGRLVVNPAFWLAADDRDGPAEAEDGEDRSEDGAKA